MLSRSVMSRVMPDEVEVNQGEVVNAEQVSLLARFSVIRGKIDASEGESKTAPLDKLVAPWFDAAVSKHPKADSLAKEYRVTPPYVSAMRHGDKPVPLRAVLPLLEHPECIDVLTNAIRREAGLPLAPREKSKLSYEQVVEMLIGLFVESPGLMRILISAANEKHGASADDVARALVNK